MPILTVKIEFFYLSILEYNMKLDYAFEKFWAGVSGMAVSPQTIKYRLADAYSSQITLVELEDLSRDLQERLQVINKAMTAVEPVGNEGKIWASINQMTEDEAVDMAKKITELLGLIILRSEE